METKRGDYHVHYTDAKALQIIEDAARRGIYHLGLVRRSEFSSEDAKALEKYGSILGIDVQVGIEHMVLINGQPVEFLVFGFDPDSQEILYSFGPERGFKQNAYLAKKQHDFLIKKGFDLGFKNSTTEKNDLDRLLRGEITDKAINFCLLCVRNPYNYDLVEKLIREDANLWGKTISRYGEKPDYRGNPLALKAKFLWSKFFAVGKEGYIPVQGDAQAFIDKIHSAGGYVIYSPEGKFDHELWTVLTEMSIDGVMGSHGKNREIGNTVREKLLQEGYRVLDGSDYDPLKDDFQIGDLPDGEQV